jgi:hypothetical protein
MPSMAAPIKRVLEEIGALLQPATPDPLVGYCGE